MKKTKNNFMNLNENIINQLKENVKAQQALVDSTLKSVDTYKKIPISTHPSLKEPFIQNDDAYHFSIGSILGDGSIHKTKHTLEIEQRSARFAMWKRGIAIDTGLIADHSIKGNYKKKLMLAKGQIVIHLPLTWKGRVKNNGPKKKPVYRRGWAFTTRALYHNPQWINLFYKQKVEFFPPYIYKGGKYSSFIEENSIEFSSIKEDIYVREGRVQYRKCLPSNIKEYFWGNLALAIFYLDDGWYDWEKKTARFSTGELTREECEYLVECLKDNFNIESVTYPKTGKPHHIFVKRTSYPELYFRVYPYFLDLQEKHPRYALNKAMKNKVLPEPIPSKIGRPKKQP